MASQHKSDQLWSISTSLNIPTAFVVGPAKFSSDSQTNLPGSGEQESEEKEDTLWRDISKGFTVLSSKPFEYEAADGPPIRFICINRVGRLPKGFCK